MRKVNFAEAVTQLNNIKGVSKEDLLSIIELAMVAAYKKKYGNVDNYMTKVDPKKETVRLYRVMTAVEEVDNPYYEIDMEEAYQKNKRAKPGSEIKYEIKPSALGRIAINAAKQVVMQKVKEIENENLFNEFSAKEGELASGIFQRVRDDDVFVDLGKISAILPKREQSPNDKFKRGERIKAYIKEVKNTPRGPEIVLSRAHPNFVAKLFAVEVPEIYEGIVEIKAISREAGYKCKIAVATSENIDPVGACVGMRGVRVQAIIRELGGEKIDLLQYSERDIDSFLASSIAPATVSKIFSNRESKTAIIVVPDEMLSKAIGRKGSNIKLASQLTGWKLDVKSETEYSQDAELIAAQRQKADELFNNMPKAETPSEDEGTPLNVLPDINEDIIGLLQAAGITTLEVLFEKKLDELKKIEGITDEAAQQLVKVLEENVAYEEE